MVAKPNAGAGPPAVWFPFGQGASLVTALEELDQLHERRMEPSGLLLDGRWEFLRRACSSWLKVARAITRAKLRANMVQLNGVLTC